MNFKNMFRMLGYCREGDYEHAEALMEFRWAMWLMTAFVGLRFCVKCLYCRQQDRVDESHSCWEATGRLENAKSFGRSERLWSS